MLWRAKKSGVARSLVASSATALAPFSQNSAVCRFSGSGSGHAQLMQSKPSAWLSLSSVLAVFLTPIWDTARCIDTPTPVTPAAGVLGWWTSSSSSSIGVVRHVASPPS